MRSLGWNPNETAETEEITEDEKREFQKLTDKVGNWLVCGSWDSVCLWQFPLLNLLCLLIRQCLTIND